jgi:hypothetical protein
MLNPSGQVESDLANLKWDGKTLRFSIPDPGVDFEMTVTGANGATLKRLASAESPEGTFQLQRK